MVTLKKRESIFLLLLFVASFIIRAVVFQLYLSHDNNYWQVDSRTYDKVAQRITGGKGITNDDGSPHFYRVPGYSLFLAGCYKLFCFDHFKALLVQLLLASFIPLLIFFLARVLLRKKLLVAWLASSYAAIHLGFVLYSGFLMTESLFLLFFLLFCIAFIPLICYRFCTKKQLVKRDRDRDVDKAIHFLMLYEHSEYSHNFLELYEHAYGDTMRKWHEQQKNLRVEQAYQQHLFLRLVVSGILLGLASLIRPVGHYLVVVSIAMLICSYDYWSEKIYKSLVFFLAWLLPVSYWLIRNFMLTGHLFFHTLPGGHFLYLSAARVAMHVHDVSYQEARTVLHKKVTNLIQQAEDKKGEPLLEIERCTIHEKLAVQYFLQRPFVTIKLWLTDMFRTCFSLFSAELLYLDSGRKQINYFAKGRSWQSIFERYLVPQTNNSLLKVIIYTELLLFLLVLIGLCGFVIQSFYQWLWFSNAVNACTFLSVAPFMMLFIVISLAGGYARMRLPIEPFIIVLSSVFWISIFIKKKVGVNK